MAKKKKREGKINLTYKSAGVDTKKTSSLVKELEKITKKNFRNEVIKNPGGFCSLLDLKKLKYKDPILLSSTDGIGTKLKVAIEHNKYNYLGFDLVGMCVNDLLANGGEPLIFLDYISSSQIKKNIFLQIIKSINLACQESHCSLVGGETAEMPDMYKNNDFDIAGFALGVVERKNLIKKEKISNNSLILGLESNGFHSNGFSLIRKIVDFAKIKYKERPPYKSSEKNFGNDLLLPTKIYVNQVLPLIKKNLLQGISHITGGGIFENLSRIIPEKYQAIIDIKKFSIPESFLWMSRVGRVSSLEMLRTFNCGIGMILLTSTTNKDKVLNFFSKNKIKYHIIGKVIKTKSNERKVLVKNFGIWNLT